MIIDAKYAAISVLNGITLLTRGSMDYKASPTLAAGDVKISIDGGAKNNLNTLPTVAPAAGTDVQVTVSDTETTGKTMTIEFIDQTAPKEWEDQKIIIHTHGHASAFYPFDRSASTPTVDASKISGSATAADNVEANIPNLDKASTAVELAIRGADSDTLETLSDQLDGVQNTVDGISNVTRLTVSLPTYMNRPSAGNTAILIRIAMKDDSGAMQDPDSNDLGISVFNSSGASRNAQLYKEYALTNTLDNSANYPPWKKCEKVVAYTGVYEFYYKVANDAAEEELTFEFYWTENAVALIEYRFTQVVDAANDFAALLTKVQSIVDKLPTGDISDFDETTDPVELLDTGGTAGTSASELVDDFFNKNGLTVGGTVMFKDIIKLMYAALRGKVVKTGSTYVFKDDDDSTTAFTFVTGPTGRTTS